MPTHLARGRISSREDRRIGDDCDGVEGGAKSKISEARFGKCRLTITPPEFSKVRERRIFRKKKLAGEDPLDPLSLSTASLQTVVEQCLSYDKDPWKRPIGRDGKPVRNPLANTADSGDHGDP